MVTATTEFRNIQKHAEAIKNDETHRIGDMSKGDFWAQGDIGIWGLDSMPAGCEEMEIVRQLAPGTTQGSRHCLASLQGVTMYRFNDANALDGPIIKAEAGCEIEHPEHGNVILPPGIYAITYQRQYAQELRRVQD